MDGCNKSDEINGLSLKKGMSKKGLPKNRCDNYLLFIVPQKLDECNCSVKKLTLHERMDGSSWSSKRSQFD